MKAGVVAFHYPRREHWDEMISRVRDTGYDERESRPRESTG